MKKKKKTKSGGGNKLPKLYQQVLDFFRTNPRKAFNYKQIAFQLGVTSTLQRNELISILHLMEREDIVDEVEQGKFKYMPDFSFFTGKVEMTQRGAAFVLVDELDEDIRVSKSLTGMALDSDTVTVELISQKKGKRLEGRIIEVIERARTEYVGTVQKMKNFAFVIPDNSRIHVDFFIPKGELKKAKDGDKVLVEMTDWPVGTPNPYGRILKVLGKAGEHETEMHAIIAEFGFKTEFPPQVEADANAYPDKISEKEIAARRDFRKTLTFTIDPIDAKDFDDAISMKKLDNGNWEIGVHIADVSHYVRPGSALDDEAFERATSVYLVDRTIPMLPEHLSNNLCSLKPNVDRLAFSVVFEMNLKAEVKNYWIGKSIIHSDKRFSYEEAQEVIEGKSDTHKTEVQLLNDLALKLQKKRFANGAISFESDEYRFVLDENGKPLSVTKKVRKEAHKMIEDFMLLANKTVAQHVHNTYKNKPLPYRVHEAPNLDKMAFFIQTAKKFGYEIKTQSQQTISDSINKMVEQSEGKMEANILHPLAIRSMEKAYYTTKETYHFGLAFDYYTHFTSPIRRYPDLMVHRLLFDYQHGIFNQNSAEIEKACGQSSKMEQRAAQAERASSKYKQIEYLSDFVGQEFEGIISGVTEWGIFVELTDNHCEGMIRISDMKGDLFEFYEKDLCVVGRRTGKKYNFGDTVHVRIKKTNLNKRTADFVFVD
ncbi:MAG: ribonuclease R [Flavobacteriales bacterium]|nr:ribonuclease R [Flavobacteriales bacterium]